MAANARASSTTEIPAQLQRFTDTVQEHSPPGTVLDMFAQLVAMSQKKGPNAQIGWENLETLLAGNLTVLSGRTSEEFCYSVKANGRITTSVPVDPSIWTHGDIPSGGVGSGKSAYDQNQYTPG